MTIAVDLGRKATKQNIHVKTRYTHAYSKTCVNGHSQKDQKLVFKTNYHLMQVQGEHSAILSTFIKLPFVIKTFVLSIFEWPFITGFTVHNF